MKATTYFVLLIAGLTSASAAPLYRFTACGADVLGQCRGLFPANPAPAPATVIQNGRLLFQGFDLGQAWNPSVVDGYFATVI